MLAFNLVGALPGHVYADDAAPAAGGAAATAPADPAPADAAPAAADPQAEKDKKEEEAALDFDTIKKKVAKATTYVNFLFNPMIHWLSFQIGSLLSNDYIFASKMGVMLKGIWITVRNIVNIIFVLVLLFMAIRHVVDAESEHGNLVKLLPKFALMLIAINFSWLGTKVVMDAANVATQVMFSLPSVTSALTVSM